MHEQTGYLNNDFRTCLHLLMEHGTEVHPRGQTTKELLNYNITLKSPRNRIITFPERKTNLRYLLGEFVWYLSGSNDPAGIIPYSKFWNGLRNSGDFDEYEKGTVNSNYGSRLFGKTPISAFWEGRIQPINQWQETIDLLIRDKDSRQAILNIHVPSDRHIGNRDIPCTIALQFFIRENALHLIVTMRSNDIVLGLTNDVFQFTMLQECMQVQLKEVYPDLELGHYFHNAGSMHIYQKHFSMAEEIITNPTATEPQMIPMDRFDQEIIKAMIDVEDFWRISRFPDFQIMGGDRIFESDTQISKTWSKLTPYWQTVVKALLFQDDDALHALVGQQEQ